jgi:glutaminyl-tRNA synthetase
VRGTIHWVAASHAIPAEIRIYNPLFTRPDPGAEGDLMADLNPNSLDVLQGAIVEPALAGDNSAAAVQFERQGYFCRDADSAPGRLVFNRTIGLRDSWAKTQPSNR